MATKPARAARVWGAAVLVAGALLMGQAPASAATTTEPASQAAVTTSTLPAPTLKYVVCIGQELGVGWTDVPGAAGYRHYIDGVWTYSSGRGYTADAFYAVSWDSNVTWTIRAVDDSGKLSPASNGLHPAC